MCLNGDAADLFVLVHQVWRDLDMVKIKAQCRAMSWSQLEPVKTERAGVSRYMVKHAVVCAFACVHMQECFPAAG